MFICIYPTLCMRAAAGRVSLQGTRESLNISLWCLQWLKVFSMLILRNVVSSTAEII